MFVASRAHASGKPGDHLARAAAVEIFSDFLRRAGGLPEGRW
jgi:hypothetical protein